MGRITDVHVITRDLVIEGDHYYLISFNIQGLTEDEHKAGIYNHMYGTLDHKFVDEYGMIKQGLSLIHLAATCEFSQVIEERQKMCEAKHIIDKLIEEGKFKL